MVRKQFTQIITPSPRHDPVPTDGVWNPDQARVPNGKAERNASDESARQADQNSTRADTRVGQKIVGLERPELLGVISGNDFGYRPAPVGSPDTDRGQAALDKSLAVLIKLPSILDRSTAAHYS